jgi:hypothetical protein
MLEIRVTGVIARRQLAQVLVASLTSEAACRKSFGLVATTVRRRPTSNRCS